MIEWVSQREWLEMPGPEFPESPPRWISFTMPFDETFACAGCSRPVSTPVHDDSFPGPVERWYGSLDGRGFTMTYHYSGPIKDQVVVEHNESSDFHQKLCQQIKAWKNRSIP